MRRGRLTDAEIKNEIKKINPAIQILGRYIRSCAPLRCKCSKCGSEWYPSWKTLRRGHGCPRCAVDKVAACHKLDTVNVKEKLKGINPRIKILGEYNNSSSPLRCKCLKCGHKWSPSWSNLNQGHGCPKCSNCIQLSTSELKLRLRKINPKIAILSEYLGNNKAPIKCKCLVCGCRWNPTWSSLSHGCGCPKCAVERGKVKQRQTLQIIKQKLRSVNQSIEILSNEYENAQSILMCKCKKCGGEWKSKWNWLQQKHGCPVCCNKLHRSEEEVRIVFESLTNKKWPRANPSEVPFLYGLTLDGYCREFQSKKFPNGTAFERQGEQHTQLHYFNKYDPKKLLEQRRRDWRKKTQCRRHGVKLIQIPYWIGDIMEFCSKKLQSVG